MIEQHMLSLLLTKFIDAQKTLKTTLIGFSLITPGKHFLACLSSQTP
jgi:hypothetical protein